MHYIIIAIVVLVIVIFLSKHVLFNPRVNSILHMLFLVMMTVAAIINSSPMIVLLIVNMIDSVRDIIIAKKYYADPEIEIDKLYMIKSLSWVVLLTAALISGNVIVTLASFVPRIAYLLIVYPIIAYLVSRDVKRKLTVGQPLPYDGDQYDYLVAKGYYYDKITHKLFEKGLLTANNKTVDAEIVSCKKKLDNLYPEKLIAKLADFFAGDKDKKDMRKEAERKLDISATIKYKAYVKSDLYQQFQNKISEALLARKNPFSPWKIKEFEELSGLNLTVPVGIAKTAEWSEYFIIQVLAPLVKDGTILDFKCSDDPMNNHQYGVEIKSIDASSNPLMALDD